MTLSSVFNDSGGYEGTQSMPLSVQVGVDWLESGLQAGHQVRMLATGSWPAQLRRCDWLRVPPSNVVPRSRCSHVCGDVPPGQVGLAVESARHWRWGTR